MASFEHTPAVAAYLPSEVARLVLGYLKDENCMKTCEMFLAECHHLKEYSTLLKQGLTYPLHVDGKSLVTILDEYRSVAQEEFDPQRPGWLKQLWRKHDIMINQLKMVHGLPYSSIHSGKQHGAGFQRPLRRLEARNVNATVDQGAALSSANSVVDITASSALVESRKQGIRRQPNRELATMSVAQSPVYSVAHGLACTAATVIGRSVSGTISPTTTEMCNTSMSIDVASASPEARARFRDSPVSRLIPRVTIRSPATIATQPPTAQAAFPVSTTTVDACSAAPNVAVSLAVSQPVYVTSSLPTVITTSSTTTTAGSSFCVRTPPHSSFPTQRDYGGTSDLGLDGEPHNICDQSTLRETVHLPAVRETPACASVTSTACPAAVATDTNHFAQAVVASVPPGSVAGTADVTMASPRRKRSSTDRKKRMTPGKNLRSPGKDDTIENLSDLFPMPCLVETLLKATDWHEHLAENINRHLTRKSTERSNDEAQNCAEEIANLAATATDEPVIRFEESETEAAIREVLALTRDDPTFNDFHALIDNVYTDLTQDPPDHTLAANLYDSTVCYSDVQVIPCDSSKVSQQATSSARDLTQGEPSPNVATTQRSPMLDHYPSHQPSPWQHNGEQQERSAPSSDARVYCATAAATAPATVHSVALCRTPCTGDSAANTTPAGCAISVPDSSANAVMPCGLVVGERRSPTASVNLPHAAIARCEGALGRSIPPLTLYPTMMSATTNYAQRATGSTVGGSRCSSRVASPTQLHSGETVESVTTGSAAGASKSADNDSMAASGGSIAASGGSMADSGGSMTVSGGSMTASGGVFVNLAPHPTESGTTMYVVISNGNKVDTQVVAQGQPRVDQKLARRPVNHIKPLRPANSAVFGSAVKPSPAVVPTASPVKLAVKPAQRGLQKSQKKKITVQSSTVSSEAARMAQRKLNALNAKTSSHRNGNHVRALTFSPSRPGATVAARCGDGSSGSSNVAAMPDRSLRGRHATASRHRHPALSPAHSPPPPSAATAAAATATEGASAAPEDTVPELVGQVIHVVEQQDDRRAHLGTAGDFVIVRCGAADLGCGTSSAISSDDDLFRHFTIVDTASEPASSGPPPAATTASVSCSNDCVQRVATNASPVPGQPVAAGIGHAYTLKKRLLNKRTMSDRLAAERKDAKKRKLKSYNINNLLSKIHQ